MANNPRAADNLIPITDSETAAALGAKGGAAKKGVKHISTWINEMLNDPNFTATIRDGIEIKEYKGAPIKAIIGAQLRMAINGDKQSADLLFKHGVTPKLLLGNDPDNPITSVHELTEEQLRDRLSKIVSSTEKGSKSDTPGA